MKRFVIYSLMTLLTTLAVVLRLAGGVLRLVAGLALGLALIGLLGAAVVGYFAGDYSALIRAAEGVGLFFGASMVVTLATYLLPGYIARWVERLGQVARPTAEVSESTLDRGQSMP